MKVWRIENKWGQGPYRWDEPDDWQTSRQGRHHPAPEADGFTNDQLECLVRWGWCCGFSSLIELFNWFNQKELDKLAQLGYITVEFEVDPLDVYIGNNQVIFRRDAYEQTKKISDSIRTIQPTHRRDAQAST